MLCYFGSLLGRNLLCLRSREALAQMVCRHSRRAFACGVRRALLPGGSPKDAYGMVRYALPHMRRGTLQVGSDAPDARLVALDGINHFHIRERLGRRPLVLVFGSFT